MSQPYSLTVRPVAIVLLRRCCTCTQTWLRPSSTAESRHSIVTDINYCAAPLTTVSVNNGFVVTDVLHLLRKQRWEPHHERVSLICESRGLQYWSRFCWGILFLKFQIKQGMIVDWTSSLKIADDVEQGLSYIHQAWRLVHGNIKSSNVLLGPDFEACIAAILCTIVGYDNMQVSES